MPRTLSVTLYSLLAASAIAAASIVMPTSADARCRGCGVAAGLFGGLAAGALIGSAIANSPPPPPRVYYYPEAMPMYGPACHLERRQVWIEGLGYRWRRFEVCG